MGGTFQSDLGVRPGDTIDGKYRVDRVIGAGGMAVVMAAHHLQLDHPVAIKVLPRHSLDHPELLARFRREARAAVRIRSEHVARILDVGELPSGNPYIVMEYLEGADLSEWLRQGPLPIEQAVEFVLQAAEAIAEAHGLGIVHRDLKPSNLFVTTRADASPCIKVLDFGISKLMTSTPGLPASSITQMTSMIGSPLYMSPEQLESARDVDARSDIWSLGVILYELLTGAPPFIGHSLPELARRITTRSPARIVTQRAEVPSGLEGVVLKCLKKRRSARYASVTEFASALSLFTPARGQRIPERFAEIMSTARSRNPAGRSDASPTEPQRPRLRFWPYAATLSHRRSLRLGMGMAAALAVTSALWVFYGRPTDNAPAAVLDDPDRAPALPTPPSTSTPTPTSAPPAAPVAATTARPLAAPASAQIRHANVAPERPSARRPPPPGDPLRRTPIKRTSRTSTRTRRTSTLSSSRAIAAEPDADRRPDASIGLKAGDDLRQLRNRSRRPRHPLDTEAPF